MCLALIILFAPIFSFVKNIIIIATFLLYLYCIVPPIHHTLLVRAFTPPLFARDYCVEEILCINIWLVICVVT
jgi:hypothetical protein